MGYLFCPIYNLRDKDVELIRGKPIAVIDFVRTSTLSSASKQYHFPPERVLFEEYDPETLISGLVTKAKGRIDEFESRLNTSIKLTDENLKDIRESTSRKLEQIGPRIDNFVLITFSVIAVLFAAVTIFVARTEQPSWWNPVLFLISGTAIFLSLQAWLGTRHEIKSFGRITQAIIILFLLAATVLQLTQTSPMRRQMNDLKKQVDLLQEELKCFQSSASAGPQSNQSNSGSATQPAHRTDEQTSPTHSKHPAAP